MFNECLEIRLKSARFCILNSSKIYFVWEVISSIRHSVSCNISNMRCSVSSPDETPRSSSKILRCASYFQLSSRCFIWWWNTASHVWYITSISPRSPGKRLRYGRALAIPSPLYFSFSVECVSWYSVGRSHWKKNYQKNHKKSRNRTLTLKVNIHIFGLTKCTIYCKNVPALVPAFLYAVTMLIS